MEQILQVQKENNWYYVSTTQALTDLRLHAHEIDNLVPFWFGVTEQGTLVDQSQPEALQVARANNLPILAIVHNYSDPQMSELIHELLTTPALRENLVNSIENMLVSRGFAGVNIDFEFVPPPDRPALNAFMENLYRRLSPRFRVTISVPAELQENPQHPFSGAFDYGTLAMLADELFILAYDEHFSTPGPVASIGFVRRVLDYAITRIPRNKIKLGMAVYGYDWVAAGGMPRTLTYNEAIALARQYGATITYDEQAQESTFTYTANGVQHIVWFEDARSFSAKLDLVNEYNLGGIAVWRLGQEDPRVWNVIRAKLKTR
ncbi:glycosyl hydrolase family 18 protein [Biomaibacter acetigenes]|uniref:glycosyl hydrolase family 18 protein n=1 Tax=Biomaibacter acetigenes TaxID=2316383 RepID=UPI001CA41779|nr:glycosyl hydrolase family 18 protein [Biomaibacter acetigenes]